MEQSGQFDETRSGMAQFTNTESQEIAASTPEPVWDCTEAARFLRMHPKTVKRRASKGQMPGCRLGRRWFFLPSVLYGLLGSSVNFSMKSNRLHHKLSCYPYRSHRYLVLNE